MPNNIYAVIYGYLEILEEYKLQFDIKSFIYTISAWVGKFFPDTFTFGFSLVDNKPNRIHAVVYDIQYAPLIASIFLSEFYRRFPKEIKYDLSLRIGLGEIEYFGKNAGILGKGEAYDLVVQDSWENHEFYDIDIQTKDSELNTQFFILLRPYNCITRKNMEFYKEFNFALVKMQLSQTTIFKFPNIYANPEHDIAYAYFNTIRYIGNVIGRHYINITKDVERPKAQSTIDKIKQYLYKDEDKFLEHKIDKSNDLYQEVLAFLNTGGGNIILGTEDNGHPVGIPIDNYKRKGKNTLKEIETTIFNHLKDKLPKKLFSPSKLVDLSFDYDENGRAFGIIEIGMSYEPVFPESGGDFFIRMLSEKQKLNSKEAHIYIEERKSSKNSK